MKKSILRTLLVASLSTFMLAGCNNDADTKQDSTDDVKTNQEKTEVTDIDISKQSAKDVTMNIYGTEVPLVATKDEIVEIGKEAGWMMWVTQGKIYVDLEVAGWKEVAPSVDFTLRDGADASSKEVYEVSFNENIDWDKVEIYGLDVKSYLDNYEKNTQFYKDLNDEIRIDIFQYNFSIRVSGDNTYTDLPEDEFREEVYGYDKADFTSYGSNEYVNNVIKAIAECDELMNLDFFYRDQMVLYIFQRLKTYEFGTEVVHSPMLDGSSVIRLTTEDENYSVDLKHNFTGETVYIREEREMMETIAEAEWDAIHEENYDKVEDYENFRNYMDDACAELKSDNAISEYSINDYNIHIVTAKGTEYDYTFGNPSSSEIMEKVFANLNTPSEEYDARRE